MQTVKVYYNWLGNMTTVMFHQSHEVSYERLEIENS